MPIPQINATGVYTVKAPFTVDPSAIYVCDSVDGFDFLDSEGVDVYTAVYEPNGLTHEDEASDRSDEEKIVTLISNNGYPTLRLPSSFILTFPSLDNVPYSRIILSFDLGVLPDELDLDLTVDQVKDLLSDLIGVTAAAKKHRLAVLGKVTAEQHRLLELNRNQSIQFRETPHSGNKRLGTLLANKDVQITALEDALIALANSVP